MVYAKHPTTGRDIGQWVRSLGDRYWEGPCNTMRTGKLFLLALLLDIMSLIIRIVLAIALLIVGLLIVLSCRPS